MNQLFHSVDDQLFRIVHKPHQIAAAANSIYLRKATLPLWVDRYEIAPIFPAKTKLAQATCFFTRHDDWLDNILGAVLPAPRKLGISIRDGFLS